MSRCFPFPPPGYEPKYRIEDIDVLKKEKHREKKHKKEKEKEKEKKREGKERRHKEKSDGKHKESKEKKDRHKEKKKNKERGRDSHNVSTSDKKRSQGQSECQREEKFSNKKQHLAQVARSVGEEIIKKEDRRNERISLSASTPDKVISSDKKRSQRHSHGQREDKTLNEKQHPLHVTGSGGEKIVKMEDRKNERISLSAEKRSAGTYTGYDGDRIGNNSSPSEDVVPKSAQEFGKTTKGGSRESGNLLRKYSDTGINKDQLRVAARPSEISVDQKNKRSTHAVVQNIAETVQTKTEGMHVKSEKSIGKKMEIKEKNKENGGGDKCGDEKVSRDGENNVQRARKKDIEKQEKPKEKNGHRHQMQDKLKDSNHCGLLGTQDSKTQHQAKDSKRIAAVDGTAKKRKDSEANGILHVEHQRSSKVARPNPSLAQNESSLGDGQNVILSTDERHGDATNIMVKEQKFNGIQEAPPMSFSVGSFPATVQNCNIGEGNVKSPHPDLKYLSEILTVPKMEELPNIGDEEWLFSSSRVKSEKLNENSRDIPQVPLVWAEALQLDSDTVALPYVIPY